MSARAPAMQPPPRPRTIDLTEDDELDAAAPAPPAKRPKRAKREERDPVAERRKKLEKAGRAVAAVRR